MQLDDQVKANLESSSIVMLLVSPDFLASDYCISVEMSMAMKLSANNKLRVVPTILRPCNWKDEEFAQFLALPKDGLPITKWGDQDEAVLDIINGLKDVIKEMCK